MEMKFNNFTSQIRENTAFFVLFAICSFLIGMICGFFLSPIKKGVTIGSNNHVVNKESGGLIDTDDWSMDYDEDEMEF